MALSIAFTEEPTANTADQFQAYGNLWASGWGLFVQVGQRNDASANVIQTSPTGLSGTWTSRTAPATTTMRAVAYAPTLGASGRAVACGNGKAHWSDDGITWTAFTSLPELNAWADVVWWPAQNLFVMCATNGVHRIATSTDGKSWTMQTAAGTKAWQGLAVSPTGIVAITATSTLSTQQVMTSTDAVTWTLVTHASLSTAPSSMGNHASIAYSAALGMFAFSVTIAGTGRTYTSTDDGATWTAQTVPASLASHDRAIYWIADVSSFYMASDDAGYYAESTDGVTWTDTPLPGTVSRDYGVLDTAWDGATGTLLVGLNLPHDLILRAVISQPTIASVSPARGSIRGGTVCTITGSGLGAVSSVTFDGVAAVSVAPAADGLSLTCIAPAHAAGAVDVVVTGVGTLTAAYTYVSVTSVSPARGTTFGGQAVTITGTGFDLASNVTFGGTSATNIQYVNPTQITCTTPQHASGAVDVVVVGVDTLPGGYTFVVPLDRLPPIPWQVPLEQPGTTPPLMHASWVTYFEAWKRRIESLPGSVPAENIVGVLDADQIPELPWSRILKTGSTLADLETVSASDMTAGVLEQRFGGTSRANAFTVAPGSFTLQDGTVSIHLSRLTLGSSDRVTALGTARVGIL